jgi:hypothetical protein
MNIKNSIIILFNAMVTVLKNKINIIKMKIVFSDNFYDIDSDDDELVRVSDYL